MVKFMNDYMKAEHINNKEDLPKGMKEQYKMCLEMFELLPVKISKLNATIH